MVKYWFCHLLLILLLDYERKVNGHYASETMGGTVVAACGREWRFQSYPKLVQRSFEGSKFVFGNTQTACSQTLGSAKSRYKSYSIF